MIKVLGRLCDRAMAELWLRLEGFASRLLWTAPAKTIAAMRLNEDKGRLVEGGEKIVGRKILLTAIAVSLSVFAVGPARSQSPEVYTLRPNERNDGFYLERYQYVAREEVTLGDMKISPRKSSEYSWPAMWTSRPDPILFLTSKQFIFDPRTDVDPGAQAAPLKLPAPQPNSKKTPNKALVDSTKLVDSRPWWEKNSGTIGSILTLLSVLPIGFFAARWWERRAKRQATATVEMVYCGLPAAGKTALIARLRHPELKPEHFDSDETTRKLELKAHDPILKSGMTFVPTAVDIPGSKPALLLERLLDPGVKYRKRVFLIVLSPSSAAGGLSTGDQSFLKTQYGYVFGLPAAILGTSKLRRPDLVAVFLNKRDTFSGSDQDFKNLFKAELALIESVCKGQDISMRSYQGSARTGDGTQGMIGSIVERLGG